MLHSHPDQPKHHHHHLLFLESHWKKHGYSTDVYIITSEDDYKGDALTALKDLGKDLKKISLFKLRKNALIVDALFGIGLKRNIKGILTKIFNRWIQSWVIKTIIYIKYNFLQKIKRWNINKISWKNIENLFLATLWIW